MSRLRIVQLKFAAIQRNGSPLQTRRTNARSKISSYAEQNKRHAALGGTAVKNMWRRLEQITFAAFMGSLVTLLVLLYADVPIVGY